MSAPAKWRSNRGTWVCAVNTARRMMKQESADCEAARNPLDDAHNFPASANDGWVWYGVHYAVGHKSNSSSIACGHPIQPGNIYGDRKGCRPERHRPYHGVHVLLSKTISISIRLVVPSRYANGFRSHYSHTSHHFRQSTNEPLVFLTHHPTPLPRHCPTNIMKSNRKFSQDSCLVWPSL